MGMTFSATIDNNNIVTVTQNPGTGMARTTSQSDLVYTQQLQTLINQYGFNKITIDMIQLETYIKNKSVVSTNYIRSLTNIINNNRQINFSESLSKNVIPQLFIGIGFIYTMADQYLLIPVVKPTQGEQNMSLIIPNFFFNSNVINNLNTILIGINPIIPQQLLPKINAIYNVFQNSLNPQLSFINLISMSILSGIISILTKTGRESFVNVTTSLIKNLSSQPSIQEGFVNVTAMPSVYRPQNEPLRLPGDNGDQIVIASIISDIAIDILNIQVNGNNNCITTSQILTFDKSICKLQSPERPLYPAQNNTMLYISFTAIIILFMIIIFLLMRKN